MGSRVTVGMAVQNWCYLSQLLQLACNNRLPQFGCNPDSYHYVFARCDHNLQ
jgi:hypothetical protein